MPKKKSGNNTLQNGRRKKEPFVMFYNAMFDSPAFLSLSAHSALTLMHFKRRYNGSNNGDIHMSNREVQKLAGCGSGKAMNVLLELQDRGFIVLVEKGQFTIKLASTYRLTFEECAGKPATNEWRQWKPDN